MSSDFDPEPDRAQIAAREDGWQIPVASLGLIDMLDAIHIPGCAEGVHEWDNEYTGDPPGPERVMSWSTTRVECDDCGQTATLVYDAPPDPPAKPDNPRRRARSSSEILEALRAGKDGSTDQITFNAESASSLYATLRWALEVLENEEA